MRTFDTPRLRLRPLGSADEALYSRLYTDPVVMRHIGAPLSADAARTAFQRVIELMRPAQPSMQVWVVHERATSTELGIIALIRHADRADAREIGAMLLVEGQGRGLAVEAQTALLDGVFTTPGVEFVWSRNAPGNAAAAGVRLKLGFARIGDGQVVGDAMRWQISRRDWNAGRAGRVEKCDGYR